MQRGSPRPRNRSDTPLSHPATGDVLSAPPSSLAERLTGLLPYVALLAAAAGLWLKAGQIDPGPPGSGLGPASWPKLVIGAMAAACCYELVRRMVARRPGTASAEPAALEEEPGPAGPAVAALAASASYLLLFETVGFAADTFMFVLLLMWLGGFRRWKLMLPISAGLTLGLMFVFMKLVFVPLPLGTGPFSLFSQALLRLLGIH